MKKLSLTLLVFFLVACASKPAPVATQQTVVSELKVVKPKVVKQEEKIVSTDTYNEEMIVQGKELYSNNCAKCHKLFDPKDFKKEDWSPILMRMQKKAHLSDDDMKGISSYIYFELR